jgi:uncharacterized protein YwgA
MLDNNSSTPWHQYAVISYVAQKVGGGFRLGKTAIQKLIYLMQELGRVPLGYRFHFYHYGPYSSDLAGDLGFVNTLKGISIDYEPSLNVYDITQGEKTGVLISKASDFIKDYEKGIDTILNDFGGKRAQELELIATIIYVWKDAQEEENYDKEYMINKVAELKPKFTISEIQASLNYLKMKGYLD